MKLSSIVIKNFRNLKDINIPIGESTILLGANNSGKSNFLHAIQILLNRSGNANVFEETDKYGARKLILIFSLNLNLMKKRKHCLQ